jgi:hypothetical protein
LTKTRFCFFTVVHEVADKTKMKFSFWFLFLSAVVSGLSGFTNAHDANDVQNEFAACLKKSVLTTFIQVLVN